jgi:chromosome segregation ATPase
MVQDLVETCLKSSQPLSKFGLNDNNYEDQQDGDNEFGRGEIGFLRREVNRLTGELVRKDETISNLSERLRKESFAKDRLREELDELDRMLTGVEEERDREKEKVGWMKEMKKGLIRDLRELETRCEELEKRHRSEGAEDGVGVETKTVGETNEDSEEGNRDNEDTLKA